MDPVKDRDREDAIKRATSEPQDSPLSSTTNGPLNKVKSFLQDKWSSFKDFLPSSDTDASGAEGTKSDKQVVPAKPDYYAIERSSHGRMGGAEGVLVEERRETVMGNLDMADSEGRGWNREMHTNADADNPPYKRFKGHDGEKRAGDAPADTPVQGQDSPVDSYTTQTEEGFDLVNKKPLEVAVPGGNAGDGGDSVMPELANFSEFQKRMIMLVGQSNTEPKPWQFEEREVGQREKDGGKKTVRVSSFRF